jgi:hypothetical protein
MFIEGKTTPSNCVDDAPPNSFRNPNVGPKMKQWKKKIVGAHSLTCNTLGV